MKTKKRILFAALILLLLSALTVCFFQFTQCGYLMTIPYRASFTEIDEHVFVNKNNSMNSEEILSLIGQAKERDEAFFGELHFTDDTYFIFCDDEKLIGKLGEDHAAVTPSVLLKKHYICISDDYLDLDILAHEITHAELHTRLSRSALKRIPTWFDEGLATQNDYREMYSEEQWVSQTDNGNKAVAPEDMDTPQEFYAGEKEDRRFRYLNAKHEVSVWMKAHGQQGLLELIDKLNDGTDFNTAYEE